MAKGDKYVTKYSRKSLRILGTVGEPINPEAWRWYSEVMFSIYLPHAIHSQWRACCLGDDLLRCCVSLELVCPARDMNV